MRGSSPLAGRDIMTSSAVGRGRAAVYFDPHTNESSEKKRPKGNRGAAETARQQPSDARNTKKT